jgi:protein-S-isoprenylcysteine O-methyltransferase Ste14
MVDWLQRVRERAPLVIAANLLLLVALFLRSRWTTGSFVHESMIWIGALFIAVAICGRTWAIVHIGRRKRWEFVSDGPYSVARHPLYAFSILGTAGMGAQTASLVFMLISVLAVWIIFDRMARIEETDMAAHFGEVYHSYIARTPRFLPKPSLWRAPSGVWVDYSLAGRSFCDSSLFAVAVPLYMVLRWAHEARLIPVLYELP